MEELITMFDETQLRLNKQTLLEIPLKIIQHYRDLG